MSKYYVKEELMCGEKYWMIYVRVFWIFSFFFERCNTLETADIRLSELNKS